MKRIADVTKLLLALPAIAMLASCGSNNGGGSTSGGGSENGGGTTKGSTTKGAHHTVGHKLGTKKDADKCGK